jgi:hypothetical protein
MKLLHLLFNVHRNNHDQEINFSFVLRMFSIERVIANALRWKAVCHLQTVSSAK